MFSLPKFWVSLRFSPTFFRCFQVEYSSSSWAVRCDGLQKQCSGVGRGRVFFFTPPKFNMGVSKNSGTPKSSILIGFSIINHPFWGTPIFGNTHMEPENKSLDSRKVHLETIIFRFHVKFRGSIFSKESHCPNFSHMTFLVKL